MVQDAVGFVKNIALGGANLVVVGTAGPDKPLHAIEGKIGGSPEKAVVVILQIKIQRDAALVKIGHALGVPGADFCPAQSREQQRGQDGDDGNHHQQFNQSESAPDFQF